MVPEADLTWLCLSLTTSAAKERRSAVSEGLGNELSFPQSASTGRVAEDLGAPLWTQLTQAYFATGSTNVFGHAWESSHCLSHPVCSSLLLIDTYLRHKSSCFITVRLTCLSPD